MGDGYYVLANIENAEGGDFLNIIAELDSIYQKYEMTREENSFSVLLKYDQTGALVSQKLIDPIDGEISVDKILGRNNHKLLIASSSKIIEYNMRKDKFKYYELPMATIELQYLKNNAIYGYSVKCNYETEQTLDNTDAIMKLNLTGKKKWKQEINIDQKIGKDKCSDLIDGVYNTELGNALSYDSGKKIAIYSDIGENDKNLDYSKVITQQDESLKLIRIQQKNKETKVMMTSNSNIMIDTFDKKYELQKRFAVGINDATLLIENISDVENIISVENSFMQNKIINRNGKLSIIRIDYPNEEA